MFLSAAHWLVSLGGFLAVNGWAQAAADAGRVPAVFEPVALVVQFVLLQPLALWLLATLQPAWWTWSGLVGLAAIVLANSVTVVATIAVARRALGYGR